MNRKKAATGFTLATILAATPVYTTFADFNAVYDSNSKSVTVSGTAVPGKAAVITIAKEKNGFPTIVEAVKADENGEYEIEILLPNGFSFGKYYVNASNEADSQSFMYIDEDLIAQSLPGLNKAVLDSGKTARDLEEYLKTNANDLAIDAEILKVYAKELSDILFLNYPDEGISQVGDFSKCYYQSLALAQIAKGEDFAQAIKNYGAYFQFDANAIYDALSDEAKARLAERLNGSKLFEEKAEICFKTNAIMAQADTAATWEMLRNAILGTDANGQTVNDNFSVINPATDYYTNLVDKNAVFQELYSLRGSLKNIEDVKKSFESVASAQYIKENTSVNPNTGSGAGSRPSSGSGGGGGSVSGGKTNSSISFDSPVGLTKEDAVDRNETVVKLTDIDGHWAANDIQALCSTGLLKGYEDGRFEPDRSITRAEFAVLLSRAFTLTAKTDALAFSDISRDDWYYNGVMEAMKAGVIYGFDGKFEPEQPVSRQDMCVMLYRAIGAVDVAEAKFSDADAISDYAKNAVGYLAAKGIVNGMDSNRFAPSETATRAEVAAIINRYLHQEG